MSKTIELTNEMLDMIEHALGTRRDFGLWDLLDMLSPPPDLMAERVDPDRVWTHHPNDLIAALVSEIKRLRRTLAAAAPGVPDAGEGSES